MLFEVFTLLPEVFQPYLESSILLRARQKGILDVRLHNIRDFARDKHHTTDDVPYGGGGGMVMKPEPVFDALESVLGPSAVDGRSVPDYPADAAGPRIHAGNGARMVTD